MVSKAITISFDADSFKLVGTLHLPPTNKPPLVIGCHGLLANRHSQKQIALAEACNQIGLAYFRFDHRGCGDSQGDFVKVTSLASRRQDLFRAIRAAHHHPDVGSLVGLFGSSFGGTVVLSYAAEYPSSTALITYAAPTNSTQIHHQNIGDDNGESPSTALLTEALSFDIRPKLSSIENILIAHCEGDETVPVAHAHEIYQSARAPKKLCLFKNGDHRMSDVTRQQQFRKQFIQWITDSAG